MAARTYIEVIDSDSDASVRHRWAIFGLRLDRVLISRSNQAEDAADRLASQLRSQIDLVRSVVRSGSDVTFALRYACRDSTQVSCGRIIDVTLLVRVRGETEKTAALNAESLAAQLQNVLSVLTPDHCWEPLADKAQLQAAWRPFDWSTCHVAELRRREELVDLFELAGEGEAPDPGNRPKVYLVKPFSPRLTSMARVLHLMMRHPSPLIFQVAVAPTQLLEHESTRLRKELVACWPDEMPSVLPGDVLEQASGAEKFLPSYAQAVEVMLLNQWLRLQGTPLLMNISVASPNPIPRTIVQTIGVELTRPPGDETDFTRVSGRLLRGDFDVVIPEDAEATTAARRNMGEMAFRPWGPTVAPQDLRRMRYLVDPVEAVTAFRFPLPSTEPLAGVRTIATCVRPIDVATVAAMQNIAPEKRTRLGMAHDLTGPRGAFLGEDERQQHVYVAGQTGTGKTTLLKSMILSDIKAGRGVAVIDPHGDLYADLLALIPESRIDDVVLLDPTDTEFPVGLNLLEASDDAARWMIVREMRAIMDRLLADQYGAAASQFVGPIFFQHMQMNMLLAMSNPDDPGTLLEFHRIFQQNKYWRRWLPLKWSDPQLKSWVQTVLPNTEYTARRASEASIGDYVASKFDEFVFDPMLRLIFGQKRSTINFGEILDQGKILLVNLSKGALTEANSRFLGMVLLSQLQTAALRRGRLSKEQRRRFCLYVDEFQNLATENFSLLLSESRKFGLSLTLANQFTSQIRSRGLLDSVFGNVGTLVAFRVGREDQEILAPYFGDGSDLTSLVNRQAIIRATFGQNGPTQFTFETELPAEPSNLERVTRICHASRKRYGRARAHVLAEIESTIHAFRLDASIEELDLSARAREGLKKLEITRLSDLTRRTESEVREACGVSEATMREIKEVLASAGLALKDSV